MPYTRGLRDQESQMWLVAAGVIADGSVDQALRGKHFKCGIRYLQLFYENLLQHALGKQLDGAHLSHEIKASLSMLRKQTIADKKELIEAYDKLWNNAELKLLVDILFEDYLYAPQAELCVFHGNVGDSDTKYPCYRNKTLG